MRGILKAILLGGVIGMAFVIGLALNLNQPKPVVTHVPLVIYKYSVFHTDTHGFAQENTLEAEAIEVRGSCIMFFKAFHVNAVICPGSMEKVVVIDSVEP